MKGDTKMTNREVLELIEKLYEKRGAWISNIAEQLHVPYETIRQIIVALGYYRGRKTREVSYNTLLNDNYIRSSLDKIACTM